MAKVMAQTYIQTDQHNDFARGLGAQSIKTKFENAVFKYLYEKQVRGTKGKYITYKTLQISDYLLPDSGLSMKEKVKLFSHRTEMNELPCNSGKPELCYFGCQEAMSNQHIILCPVVNSDKTQTVKYEYLLDGNVAEKKKHCMNFTKMNNYLRNKN